MSRTRLIRTVGGTAVCALGIGYFMQMGGAETQAVSAPLPQTIQQAVSAPAAVADHDQPLNFSDITLISTQPDMKSPVPLTAPLFDRTGGQTDATNRVADPAAPADQPAAGLGCEVKATAVPAAMASVDLSVSAPCFGNERVTVHHSGLMFTNTTDKDGNLNVLVPGLSEKAVFIVAFASGKGAVATTKIPDLGEYDRVALQWTGNTGFELHAREFGAAYGEVGHVWSGADRSGAAGIVNRLGDADTLSPQLAEIYTFPAAASARAGSVALTVEAEVTDGNCGRDVTAQSLESRGGAGLRTQDLVMSMPNCAALGDFLVLNNLFDDLKIAAK